MTYDNPSRLDTAILEGQLRAATSDPTRAAGVVARAQVQGQRRLRRRRRLVSAGAVTVVIAGLSVAGVQLLRSELSSTPIAGQGNVRTVPDPMTHESSAPVFVVDPDVEQRAGKTFDAAVSAALPSIAAGQVQVSSSGLEMPLGTGQRGWSWTSEVSGGDPYTVMWLDVDQFKPQPALAVSPCEAPGQVECSYEVLSGGGYVVSGYYRGTAELADARKVDTLSPYARLIRADGRVVETQVMFLPGAGGGESPEGITLQALQTLVTDPRLGEVALPTAVGAD